MAHLQTMLLPLLLRLQPPGLRWPAGHQQTLLPQVELLLLLPLSVPPLLLPLQGARGLLLLLLQLLVQWPL